LAKNTDTDRRTGTSGWSARRSRLKLTQLCEGIKSVLKPQIFHDAVKIFPDVLADWRLVLYLDFRQVAMLHHACTPQKTQ
jgi:hypothetical protein